MVTLTGCKLINDSATGAGGGLYNQGTATLTNSEFGSPFASIPFRAAADGGGLYNSGPRR